MSGLMALVSVASLSQGVASRLAKQGAVGQRKVRFADISLLPLLAVALACAGLDVQPALAEIFTSAQITRTTNCDNILFFAGGAISGDGTHLAFASDCNLTGQNADGNFEIYRFDSTANRLAQITTTSGCNNGYGYAFSSGVISADGTRIAFLSECNLTGQNTSPGEEIYLYDSTTDTMTQITTSSGCRNSFPSLNADGTRLAFASECDLTGQNADHNFEIYRFDTTSDTLTQITTSSDCGSVLTSLNADGTRLAFASNCNLTGDNADNNDEIYRFDATTNTLTQITTTTGCDNGAGSSFTSVAINADGTRIAFLSDCNLTGQNPAGNPQIFRFDIATNRLSQIATANSDCGLGSTALNADGTRLAFSSSCNLTGQNAAGNAQIFRLDSTINTLTQITTGSGCDSSALSLNADGTRLAFASMCNLTGQNADGNAEIFLASAASSTDAAGGGGDGCQVSPLRAGGLAWLIPAVSLLAIRRRHRSASGSPCL